MDAKITLSFDAEIIARAKSYADEHGISLSRLTEVLLRKATASGYPDIEDMPVSSWVSMVAEGKTEYITPRKRKDIKEEYYGDSK